VVVEARLKKYVDSQYNGEDVEKLHSTKKGNCGLT
jgi:hypothetical protein